jgi:Flp pilus assembly protein CpaB
MRLRTFLLLLLVLAVLAVAAVLAYVRFFAGDGGVADVTPGLVAPPEEGEQPTEPGLPPPTPTPVIRFEEVIVAARSLPVGTVLREDLLQIELRPTSNIALQGQYAFNNINDLIGQVVKTEIAAGQAILIPMLALNATDLANFGSDLALYVDQGKVAVAFPINRYTGAAYAMRPGDAVDVLMSLPIVSLDPEFNTMLPNVTERVDGLALAEGRSFLFPQLLEGRLELIDELNLVGEVSGPISEQEEARSTQVQRRATQLTIQQATVIWVGTWRDPRELEAEAAAARELAELSAGSDFPLPTPTPLPERLDATPDVVILSMPAQDALALKWALERGVDVTLTLRSPGDSTVFSTTTVSLPYLVDIGALRIPERSEFDIAPSMRNLEFPRLDQNQDQNP